MLCWSNRKAPSYQANLCACFFFYHRYDLRGEPSYKDARLTTLNFVRASP